MKRIRDGLRAFWSDAEKRRRATWLFGVLAVLALLYGGYTLLDAHNRYTELNAAAERLGPPKPNDPGNTALALMLRDRDKAENRRWQGVMFLGLGFVSLGMAYVFMPASRRTSGEDAASPLSDAPPRDPPN